MANIQEPAESPITAPEHATFNAYWYDADRASEASHSGADYNAQEPGLTEPPLRATATAETCVGAPPPTN